MINDKIKQMIKVMQAYLDGEEVEFFGYDNTWWPVDEDCPWNGVYQYRIKPKPKDIWVNEYNQDGSVYAVYSSSEAAKGAAGVNVARKAVHYREVIEDDSH